MDEKLDSPFRRSIFRKELDGIWGKHNISEEIREQFLHSIFENPFQINEQYLVKGGFTTRKDLRKILGKLPEISVAASELEKIFIIESDLNIPSDLLSEFVKKDSKIAMFLGAGASKSLRDYPDWSTLGSKAINEMLLLNLINLFEKERIEDSIKDPKQKLTIFESIIAPPGKYEHKRDCKAYKNFYEKCFKHAVAENSNKNPTIYDLVVKFETIKITSNIDNEFFLALKNYLSLKSNFENKHQGEIAEISNFAQIKSSDFSSSSLDVNTIYHIHGHIDNVDSLVMTTRDYIKAYYDTKGLANFLEQIFKEYTVIFIGYSISEFSILEHILKCDKRHYALLNAFLNEQNIIKMNQSYFDTFGIKMIPYYMDFNGYCRLEELLISWLNKIEEIKFGSVFKKINEIDEVI